MKELTQAQITEYAQWVYHECNDPISEIDWLVQVILSKDEHLYFHKKIMEVLWENK